MLHLRLILGAVQKAQATEGGHKCNLIPEQLEEFILRAHSMSGILLCLFRSEAWPGSCVYQLLAETLAKASATQTHGFSFYCLFYCLFSVCRVLHKIGVSKGHICCPVKTSEKMLDITLPKASTFRFLPPSLFLFSLGIISLIPWPPTSVQTLKISVLFSKLFIVKLIIWYLLWIIQYYGDTYRGGLTEECKSGLADASSSYKGRVV